MTLTFHSHSVVFSAGLLGKCERLLVDGYPVGFALSLDQRRFGWIWRIWDAKGELRAAEGGDSYDSRAEAIEGLYAYLKEKLG
jgi:hypothetical protein